MQKAPQLKNKEPERLIVATTLALQRVLRDPSTSLPPRSAQAERVKEIFDRMSSGQGGGSPKISNTNFLEVGFKTCPIAIAAAATPDGFLKHNALWSLSARFASAPTEFAIRLKAYWKKALGVYFNEDVARILTDKEVEATLLHEDFHNKLSTIVRTGVSKILSASAINAAAVGLYIKCVGGIDSFMNNGFRFWNGHNFLYAVGLAFYATLLKKLVKAKIQRTEETHADNNAKSYVGKEAISSALVKMRMYMHYIHSARPHLADSPADLKYKEKEADKEDVTFVKYTDPPSLLSEHPTTEERITQLYGA